MLSGNVTSCRIVTLTSNVRAPLVAVLTLAPTMLTLGDHPVVSMRTAWPPDTRQFAPAPRPILETHSCHVAHSPWLTCVIPILVVLMRFVNRERIKGQERTVQCVFVMKAIEVRLKNSSIESLFLVFNGKNFHLLNSSKTLMFSTLSI